MASAQFNSQPLPQGFSIYQPALGAQLQFLPAVGTPELDELIDCFVPGSASMQEKRAAVSLDFLHFTQNTGESFKFYPVFYSHPSSMTGSPVTDSVPSSFNNSPLLSSWDFSQVTMPSPAPSSTHTRKSRTSSPPNKAKAADFSHMPGMKIMTKDGIDVTHQASRGSKTKEQRDHAHLMRIIKACDACRRKKVRCDPSHKKRSASAASPTVVASSSSRVNKKARVVSESCNAPTPAVTLAGSSSSSVETPVYAAYGHTFYGMEEPLTAGEKERWEDFVDFTNVGDLNDYDFFQDPQGCLSSFGSSVASGSSSASPSSASPSSGDVQVPTDFARGTPHISPRTDLPPSFPASISQGGSIAVPDTYDDFALFSPQSTFSEDDRMITMSSHLSEPAVGRTLSTPAELQQSTASLDSVNNGSLSAALETRTPDRNRRRPEMSRNKPITSDAAQSDASQTFAIPDACVTIPGATHNCSFTSGAQRRESLVRHSPASIAVVTTRTPDDLTINQPANSTAPGDTRSSALLLQSSSEVARIHPDTSSTAPTRYTVVDDETDGRLSRLQVIRTGTADADATNTPAQVDEAVRCEPPSDRSQTVQVPPSLISLATALPRVADPVASLRSMEEGFAAAAAASSLDASASYSSVVAASDSECGQDGTVLSSQAPPLTARQATEMTSLERYSAQSAATMTTVFMSAVATQCLSTLATSIAETMLQIMTGRHSQQTGHQPEHRSRVSMAGQSSSMTACC